MNSIKCPRCGLVSFATAIGCKRCQSELTVGQIAAATPVGQFSSSPNTDQTAPFQSLPEYEPVATPIGGWLIVFALGIGISLGLAVLYIQSFVNFVWTPAFQALTTEGSNIYVSTFSSGLVFELIWLSTMAVGSIVLLLRFFRKSSSFPRLAIAILAANIAFAFLDYLLGLNVERELTAKLSALYGRGKVPDLLPGYIGLVVLYSIVSSGVWITYFLTSRRVESTFVH